MPLSVSDARSNAPEQIEQVVNVIGRSPQRRAVFAAIYRGRKATKTVAEIAEEAHLSEKQVLTRGKELAEHEVVEQTTVDGRVAYSKDPWIKRQRDTILRFLDRPDRLAAIPTKRRPASSPG